jgi:hypothetical protein
MRIYKVGQTIFYRYGFEKYQKVEIIKIGVKNSCPYCQDKNICKNKRDNNFKVWLSNGRITNICDLDRGYKHKFGRIIRGRDGKR